MVNQEHGKKVCFEILLSSIHDLHSSIYTTLACAQVLEDFYGRAEKEGFENVKLKYRYEYYCHVTGEKKVTHASADLCCILCMGPPRQSYMRSRGKT